MGGDSPHGGRSRPRRHGWRDETPLWFYFLREADIRQDGEQLGPVGGRIVGEVLFGLIDNDPELVPCR